MSSDGRVCWNQRQFVSSEALWASSGPLLIWRPAEGQGAAFLMSISIDMEAGGLEILFSKRDQLTNQKR